MNEKISVCEVKKIGCCKGEMLKKHKGCEYSFDYCFDYHFPISCIADNNIYKSSNSFKKRSQTSFASWTNG